MSGVNPVPNAAFTSPVSSTSASTTSVCPFQAASISALAPPCLAACFTPRPCSARTACRCPLIAADMSALCPRLLMALMSAPASRSSSRVSVLSPSAAARMKRVSPRSLVSSACSCTSPRTCNFPYQHDVQHLMSRKDQALPCEHVVTPCKGPEPKLAVPFLRRRSAGRCADEGAADGGPAGSEAAEPRRV